MGNGLESDNQANALADVLGLGEGEASWIQSGKQHGTATLGQNLEDRSRTEGRMTYNIRIDRIQARKLIEQGLTNIEVAQALGCTKQQIPELKRELGLPIAARRPKST